MSSTTPGDLATSSWNGDTEQTAVTNEAAGSPGFPATTTEGETVFIVEKLPAANDEGQIFVANDGRRFINRYNNADGLELVGEGETPEVDPLVQGSQTPDQKVAGEPQNAVIENNTFSQPAAEPEAELEEEELPPVA